MNDKLPKDMMLLAKYMRRLALKYPSAYINTSKITKSTHVHVTYLEKEVAEGVADHYSHCLIFEDGKQEETR